MTKFVRLASFGFLFCLLNFPAVAGDKILKSKDIKSLFPGTYMAKVSGYKVVIKARGNGTLKGSAFHKTDKGRWWVKGNRLCVSWSNWTDGKATCGRIKQSGDWYETRSAKGPMKFRRI
ncbi:MAG: hypothetical protein ACR2OJ_07605 [Hyphomicrobiales bacterium]